MKLPKISILAALVILLCLSIIAFNGVALYRTIPLPALNPTYPNPTSILSTTPTILPANGFIKLPDTTENIHVAQIFNGSSPLGDEKGKVDLVWGSVSPTKPKGVYNLYYYPFNRDEDAGTGGTHHDITWFLANHPDWIEYTCDKKTPAYEYNETRVPLDISNPAVIEYIIRTYIYPAIQEGYQGIAFDNVDFSNNGSRCGIWRNKVWVKQTNYIGDVLHWASTMYKALHAMNICVAMNFPYDFSHPAESYQIYQFLDIAVDERGFTNRGQLKDGYYLSKNEWNAVMQAYQFLDANGKGFVSINEMPEHFAEVSQAEKQWALANYLLAKGQISYIAITGIQEYGYTFITPEYSAPIGSALGPMYQSQGVVMRDFSNGKAIVNPSSFNQTFTVLLPPGVYQDLYGNKINQLTLGAQSGIVLLGKSAPASYLFLDRSNTLLSLFPFKVFHNP